MASKGVKAKLENLTALDVPYFLYPALGFHEKAVWIPRAVTGLISRRREVVPLVVAAPLLWFGMTLWILPAVLVTEAVLLWDWVENDRSGKARRRHSYKRKIQNGFIRCREDKKNEHPIDSLPIYLSHGEFPPRSDPPDEATIRERVMWRWKHQKPHTVVVMLGLTPACDDVRLGKIAGQVGKYFRADCRFQNYRNGTAKLTIRHRDVLDSAVKWQSLKATPQQIPIGINRLGIMVGRGLMDGGGGRSWLVAGMRGSGKSAFLNSVLAYAMRFPHVELYLIDPLGGVDMEHWWPLATRVAVDPRETLELLEDIVGLMGERMVAMTGRMKKIVEPTDEFPLRILLIDELADLTLNGDKKYREDCITLLAEYNRKGRKTADVLIAATQDTRKEIVPGRLAGQFSDKIGFHCASAEMNQIVFGARLAELDGGDKVNLAAIKDSHQGRGWWLGGSPTLEELRMMGLYDDDQIEAEVSRIARQRQAASQVQPAGGENRPGLWLVGSSGVAEQATSGTPPPPIGEGKQPIRAKGDATGLVYEEIVKANGVGTGAAEIATKLTMPRKTVNNAIATLREKGLIENRVSAYRYTAKETNS